MKQHKYRGSRVSRAILVLVFALAGSLATTSAIAGWESATAVDNAPAALFGPTTVNAISVGANGLTTALFIQKGPDTQPASSTTGSPFALRRATGSTTAWSAPTVITVPAAGQAKDTSSAAVASKSDGSAIGSFGFVPMGGSDQTLATAWPTGDPSPTQAAAILCTPDATPICATHVQRVAFDGTGIAYAIGTTGINAGSLLFARTNAAGIWQPAQLLQTTISFPNLAVNLGGTVVLAYARSGKVYGRRLPAGATAFEVEAQISGANFVSNNPTPPLVIDPTGTATITFLEDTASNTSGVAPSLRAVRWPLAAPPIASQTLSDSTAGQILGPGTLAVDPQGRVTAAWFASPVPATGSIFVAQLVTGNAFVTPAPQVSPSNSTHTFNFPLLAVDDSGTLTLIYADSPDPSSNLALVAQRKALGQPWSALTTITSAATGAAAVVVGSYRVASRKPGQADVTFVQTLSGTDRLFATRFNDVTKPTITLTAPVDVATFSRGQVVNAVYACADEPGGSGITTSNCTGNVASGSPIDTATAGAKRFTVTATDNAGNTDSKTVSYTVTGPADTIAPTITLTTPAEGASFTVGQVVNASYTCVDDAGGSGVKTCTGTVANGMAIDTATAGTKSFTVNTADNANNTAMKTVSYTVTAAGGGGAASVTDRSGALDLSALLVLLGGVWGRRRRRLRHD